MQQEDILIPCSAAQRVLIRQYFNQLELESSIPDLYWLPVPEELLSDLQAEHLSTCGPYALALEICEEGLSLETLVRAQNQLHCECIAFASPELVQHMLDYLNLVILQRIKV